MSEESEGCSGMRTRLETRPVALNKSISSLSLGDLIYKMKKIQSALPSTQEEGETVKARISWYWWPGSKAGSLGARLFPKLRFLFDLHIVFNIFNLLPIFEIKGFHIQVEDSLSFWRNLSVGQHWVFTAALQKSAYTEHLFTQSFN